MSIQSRYHTLKEIKSTNAMQIEAATDGVSVADALLSVHMMGAPVVDDQGACIGFVSEAHLLDALIDGKNLEALTAREMMGRPHTVQETLPIEAAIRYMDERHLEQLPVVKDRRLVKTVTRHDLLRALLNLGLGVEQ